MQFSVTATWPMTLVRTGALISTPTRGAHAVWVGSVDLAAISELSATGFVSTQRFLLLILLREVDGQD